jgi:hypothetical protein
MVKVAGAYKPQALPKPARAVTVDGYHLRIVKIAPSPLKAISSALVYMTVTDPDGKPVTFTPWYGALAHAIFFHHGRFEYFHTHVCSPGAGGCASVLGGSRVTGSSATPGHITVGVLLPDSGTWRLFLQFQSKGRILTAPFTLDVGGHTATGEDSVFRFNASIPKSGTVTFTVRQTYSDGSVVDWSGPETSDTPAPSVQALSSFGGGGSSTLGIIAIVLAGAALLIAVLGLAGGKRTLA